jgi:hypothetical protein
MIKYAIHPGSVISKSDGQKHFINAYQLIRLYGVDMKECCMRYDNEPFEDLLNLYPRYEGDYKEHLWQLQYDSSIDGDKITTGTITKSYLIGKLDNMDAIYVSSQSTNSDHMVDAMSYQQKTLRKNILIPENTVLKSAEDITVTLTKGHYVLDIPIGNTFAKLIIDEEGLKALTTIDSQVAIF